MTRTDIEPAGRAPGPASAWLLFLVPCVIWGTTWLVIKFQLGVVAPEVSVAWRFGIAAVLLLGYCAARRVRPSWTEALMLMKPPRWRASIICSTAGRPHWTVCVCPRSRITPRMSNSSISLPTGT